VIVVGTSGWQYRDWRGAFYPEKLPQRRWLEYFSQRYPTVEVNNSFYVLPKPETFARWREQTPPGFVVTVKASRYITHIRRLRDADEAVDRLMANARSLGEKLGPVLFQLPPNMRADVELLRSFLAGLPGDVRPAVEFRHETWDTDQTREALDEAGAALVLPDRPGRFVEPWVTGGWSYVRFHQGGHGPGGHDYPREKLRRWADRIASMEAREVWVYFNNDPTGAAIRDADTLVGLLRDRGADIAPPPVPPAERLVEDGQPG
jgi:uncharacterized protein YecE (DUF72 family)